MNSSSLKAIFWTNYFRFIYEFGKKEVCSKKTGGGGLEHYKVLIPLFSIWIYIRWQEITLTVATFHLSFSIHSPFIIYFF